jgi:transposase
VNHFDLLNHPAVYDLKLPPETGVRMKGQVMGRPSKFDGEFRAHAVELVRISKRPRCQIASELGISDTTLAKWVMTSDDRKEPDELSVPEREELEQLRREKREWLVEREILKKAQAFWVRECQG